MSMVVAVAKWLILGITKITNQNPELFPFYNFLGHLNKFDVPTDVVWFKNIYLCTIREQFA